MLTPIKNIEALFVFRNEPAGDPYDLQVVQTYLNGAQGVRDQVSLTGSLAYISRQRAVNTPTWKDLGVTVFPTLLFIDKDNQRILTRLVSARITPTNVANTLLEINGMQKDPEGNYFRADGSPFGREGSEGDSWGIGPGLNIPVPKFLYLVSAAWGINKALTAEMNTCRIVGGTVATFSLRKYFSNG